MDDQTTKDQSVSHSIQPYCAINDQLHIINNILSLTNNIVISESMRKYIVKVAHVGHHNINS